MKSFKEYLIEGREWTGVDLDMTLAHYTKWKGVGKIGKPIPKMVDRIKKLLDNGEKVKIFTARANNPKDVKAIKKWLVDVAKLPELEVTNKKDQFMIRLYDDRAIQVKKNTGEIIGKEQPLDEKLGTLAAALLSGAMLLPNMAQAKNPHDYKHHKQRSVMTQQTTPVNFNDIVNLITKHEGLEKGQTPFKITNPKMKSWDTILGFKIDKDAQKQPNRQNFIYLENPSDVTKAVKKQFENYATNPTKYGLPPNVTLKDAISKFDQTGAKGKISYLLKNIPKLDINQPLKKLV
jgi:hypothetical protein